MPIRSFHVANYKGYKELAEVEIRPLTILVGRNNAGKSALLRAGVLIAHSLTGGGKGLVQLKTEGISHASSFEELVYGQHIHGALNLGVTFGDGAESCGLSVWIQNVVQPKQTPARVVSRFRLTRNCETLLEAHRSSVLPEEPLYRLTPGSDDRLVQLDFEGLLPRDSEVLPQQASILLAKIRQEGMRMPERLQYLRAQRAVPERIQEIPAEPPRRLSVDGSGAPEMLAFDDRLRKSVASWFEKAFGGLRLDITRTGPVFQLAVRGGEGGTAPVSLENAGHGLSQVLPVVVQRLASKILGPGLDLIEQPESDLHPAAHAAVADLFVESMRDGGRSALIETHSEMFLLRVRRRIAEGRLSPDSVGVYWVDADSQGGAVLREVRIGAKGEVEGWPHGVFFEDYEEVLALRRAARNQEGGG